MDEKDGGSNYEEDKSDIDDIINFVSSYISNFRFGYVYTARKTKNEVFFLLFVTLFALFTYNYNIEKPKGIVFDEVYFGNFTQYYLTGEYFFDIHPPTVKLLFALVGSLANITRYNYNYKLGDDYNNNDYVYLRTFSAFCGALKVPLLYLALRLSGVTPWWAVCASVMCAVDNGLIVEARHVLTDGVLHLFTAICILGCAIVANVPCMRYFGVIIACIGVALAVTSKFTAGGLIATCFFSCIFKYGLVFICRAGLLLTTSVFIMTIIAFYFHFKLLTRSGTGCPYHYKEFCDNLGAGNLTVKTIYLLQNMHYYNHGINVTHSCQSYPYEWPIMAGKSLFMYSEPNDGRKQIWCIGTLSVWFIAFLSLLFFIFHTVINTPIFVRNSYLLFGYLASYLPFFLVKRPMWNYHYHIPLIHTIAMTGFVGEYLFDDKIIYPVSIIAIHMISFAFLWSKTYCTIEPNLIAKANDYLKDLFHYS